MRVATWNVNGIRAREAQVLEWIAREQPDVICLQELKAHTAQVPASLAEMDGYWCCWHGERGYSGVGLHVKKTLAPARPDFFHPAFDFEQRIAAVRLGDLVAASVYVPNGGKDYAAKLGFLEALERWAAEAAQRGDRLVICGDFNVTRTDMDVHPKERKPLAIGQRPEERALMERILAHGLVDVHRALEPDNDRLFTWWAPWRNMRERDIGWRIDYVVAAAALAATARACVSQREVGTSDHAPVIADFV